MRARGIILHASNIVSIAASKKGVALFQGNHHRQRQREGPSMPSGERCFAMNQVTFNKLQAEALDVNAAGKDGLRDGAHHAGARRRGGRAGVHPR